MILDKAQEARAEAEAGSSQLAEQALPVYDAIPLVAPDEEDNDVGSEGLARAPTYRSVAPAGHGTSLGKRPATVFEQLTIVEEDGYLADGREGSTKPLPALPPESAPLLHARTPSAPELHVPALLVPEASHAPHPEPVTQSSLPIPSPSFLSPPAASALVPSSSSVSLQAAVLSVASASVNGTSSPPSTSRRLMERSLSWITGSRRAEQKAAREQTITTLRGLVERKYDDPAGVIDSCAQRCLRAGLVFRDLMQEDIIEGRTPLYWAIVRLADGPREPDTIGQTPYGREGLQAFALTRSIVAHTSPITGKPLSDAHLACTQFGDNKLWYILRAMPGYCEASPADRLIFGDQQAHLVDQVDVNDTYSDEGSFRAIMSFPRFLQRMRAANSIEVQFMARRRIFVLTFRVGRAPGQWTATLTMMEHSAPAHVNAKLKFYRPNFDFPVEDEIIAGAPDTDTLLYSHQLDSLPPAAYFKFKTRSKKLGPLGSKSTVKELSAKIVGDIISKDGSSCFESADLCVLKIDAALVKPPKKHLFYRNHEDTTSSESEQEEQQRQQQPQ